MCFNYTVRFIHPLSITLRATGFEGSVRRIFNLTLRSYQVGLNCYVASIYLKKYPSKNTSTSLRTTGFEVIEYTACYNIPYGKSVCPLKVSGQPSASRESGVFDTMFPQETLLHIIEM